MPYSIPAPPLGFALTNESHYLIKDEMRNIGYTYRTFSTKLYSHIRISFPPTPPTNSLISRILLESKNRIINAYIMIVGENKNNTNPL